MGSGIHLGLTGGIGSGKSTVASLLVECGATLVDTDAIARELTARSGAALPALAQAFGREVIADDGSLDRDRMRALAFGDSSQRRLLESILHPMIGERARRDADRAGDRPVVFDVPLLNADSSWRRIVSRVLVVDCRESTQVERVVRRSGWSPETVERVMAQQLPRRVRRRLADAVIYNDGLDLAALRAEVEHLWRSWVTA